MVDLVHDVHQDIIAQGASRCLNAAADITTRIPVPLNVRSVLRVNTLHILAVNGVFIVHWVTNVLIQPNILKDALQIPRAIFGVLDVIHVQMDGRVLQVPLPVHLN